MMRTIRTRAGIIVGLSFALLPAFADAQSSTLKVFENDTTPVPFANVSIEGGIPSITNERGELSFGAVRGRTLTLDVRRIGYRPYFGKVEIPDTAITVKIMMPRLAQALPTVAVNGERVKSRLELAGFYDRWLMRQKGTLSATFIGPEELDRRHPAKTTDMLYGVNGISMAKVNGVLVPRGQGGMCFMTVLLDGAPLCPKGGCYMSSSQGPSIGGKTAQPFGGVDIDQYLMAQDVSGIEVYARGGNMPISLQAFNSACGVIAIWTGPRK